jgi:hypothetical protein
MITKSLATGRVPYFIVSNNSVVTVRPPEASFIQSSDGQHELDCELLYYGPFQRDISH